MLFPTRDPRDIVVDLPPGLLGNPQAVERCPIYEMSASAAKCPVDTQVGYAVLHLLGGDELIGPIVNLVPETGQSAEFGLETSLTSTICSRRMSCTISANTAKMAMASQS